MHLLKKIYIYLKNTGQLDPTRNPTQPATRLTRLKMTHFDPWPVWPDLPVLPCLAFFTRLQLPNFNIVYLIINWVFFNLGETRRKDKIRKKHLQFFYMPREICYYLNDGRWFFFVHESGQIDGSLLTVARINPSNIWIFFWSSSYSMCVVIHNLTEFVFFSHLLYIMDSSAGHLSWVLTK